MTRPKYKLPDGRYRRRLYLPDGSHPQGTFDTKRELDQWVAEQLQLRAEMKRSGGRGRNSRERQTLTVGQWARRRHDARTFDCPATELRNLNYLHHIVDSKLGAMLIADVEAIDVEEWLKDRRRVLPATSTGRNLLSYTRGMFDAAVDSGKCNRNPVPRKLRLSRAAKRETVPLTIPQVWALADAFDAVGHGELRATVPVMGLAGLRPAETLGLVGESVLPLHRREIRVDGQVRAGTRVRVPTLKTDGSRRTVETCAALGEELGRHIATYGVGVDGSLFHHRRDHRVISRATYQKAFDAAVRVCRQADPTFPYCTPKSLRHTYTSLGKDYGLSSMDMAHELGHTSGKLVDEVYGHRMPDRPRGKVRSAFDEMIAQNQPNRTPAVRAAE